MSANIRRVEREQQAAEPSHLRRWWRSPSAPTAARWRRRSAATCWRFTGRCAAGDGVGPRGGDARHAGQRAGVAALPLPGRPGRQRRRQAAAAQPLSGLRAGQPPQLLPVVEHAGRRAAGAARPRAICTGPRCWRRRPAACCATIAPARWRWSSAATGWTSAASRSTTASTASASPASTTSCARRCSRSRCASSWTSSAQDGSVLDFLYGRHTFVNPALAKHYGMPVAKRLPRDAWVRVDDADRYQRGRHLAHGGVPDQERARAAHQPGQARLLGGAAGAGRA